MPTTFSSQNLPAYLPSGLCISYDWCVLDTLKHSKPAAYTAVLERLFAVWLKVLPRDITYCLQTIRAELALRAGDDAGQALFWLEAFSKNPEKYVKGCAEIADELEAEYEQQAADSDAESVWEQEPADELDDPQAPQL